jgi:hypothetical protein
VTAKAVDAARRYREKFGVMPDTCYVNRTTLSADELAVPLQTPGDAILRLRPAKNIRPNHFWVGIEG